jgi:antitoxin ParD1/3/4
MSTTNISLPEALKAFVDEQVAGGGYATSSEYVRELIRRDQDRQRLRALLIEGASSNPHGEADQSYFDGLRERVQSRKVDESRAASRDGSTRHRRCHRMLLW